MNYCVFTHIIGPIPCGAEIARSGFRKARNRVLVLRKRGLAVYSLRFEGSPKPYYLAIEVGASR